MSEEHFLIARFNRVIAARAIDAEPRIGMAWFVQTRDDIAKLLEENDRLHTEVDKLKRIDQLALAELAARIAKLEKFASEAERPQTQGTTP